MFRHQLQWVRREQDVSFIVKQSFPSPIGKLLLCEAPTVNAWQHRRTIIFKWEIKIIFLKKEVVSRREDWKSALDPNVNNRAQRGFYSCWWINNNVNYVEKLLAHFLNSAQAWHSRLISPACWLFSWPIKSKKILCKITKNRHTGGERPSSGLIQDKG